MKSIIFFALMLASVVSVGQTLSDTTITATDYARVSTDTWKYDFVTDTINAEDDPDTLIINIPHTLGRAMYGYYAVRADTIPDTTALSAVLYVEELHSDPGEVFNTGSDYDEAAVTTDSNAIPIDGTWTDDTFACTTTFIRLVILSTAGQGVVHIQVLLRPN